MCKGLTQDATRKLFAKEPVTAARDGYVPQEDGIV